MATELTKAQLELAQAEADLRKAQIKDGDNHASECQRETDVMMAIQAVIDAEEALTEELEEHEEEDETSWVELEAAEKRIQALETRLTEMQTNHDSRHSELMAKLDGLKPVEHSPTSPSVQVLSPQPANPTESPVLPTAAERPNEPPASVPEKRKIRKI